MSSASLGVLVRHVRVALGICLSSGIQPIPDTPTNEAKLEDLEDLEIDLNNLDQPRSKYQRLQAEADTKPAAKKNPPKDDGKDKKMPTVDRQQAPTPQPRNHHTMPAKRTTGQNNSGISPKGVVDMTQGTIRACGTGPPHVDHPVLFVC